VANEKKREKHNQICHVNTRIAKVQMIPRSSPQNGEWQNAGDGDGVAGTDAS
jgi:hypothetical protein